MTLSCPICKKPVPWEDNPSRPFCSERCRLIDLGAWVSGEYSVPGEELHSGEDDPRVRERDQEED